MKILTDTPDRLVIEHRPVLLATALVAMTLLLVYAMLDAFAAGDTGKALFVMFVTLVLMGPAFWFALERVQVIFDRRARTCTRRVRRLSGTRVETHPLDSITRAMVQTRKGDHDTVDTHRVALVIGTEHAENRHGLTTSYRNGPRAQKVVERINAWLDSGPATA